MLARDTVLQNRYRIVRQLGQGGMGTVYEAVDERLDTIVALKESHFTDERLRKQFEREARLLARLRHPAMTRVIDHFTEGDGQFLVMDFVAGEDLWEMMQRRGGAFPLEDVLIWADQLLDALDYLHRQDPPVIHRDIKPQNLKLSDTGQIILLDFGLAKGFAGQISRVTTSGSIFGYTPNYAPLEQIQGTGTEPRSDLYSLSATLYHLLAGAMPPDVLTRLTATTEGQPDPLRSAHEVNGKVSADVAHLLHRGMAVARNQRFASAAEMRGQLRELNRIVERPGLEPETETLLPTMISPPRVQEQSQPKLPPTVASQPAEPAPEQESLPTVKAEAKGRSELSEDQRLQLEYWTEFANFLKQNSWLNPPKPLPQHWMAFEIGSKNFMLSATIHLLDKGMGVNLTISGPEALEHFHLLQQDIDKIEESIGSELDWKERPGRKESHIISYQEADPADRKDWPNQHDWLREELEAFHDAFASRIAELPNTNYADESSQDSDEDKDVEEYLLNDAGELRPHVQEATARPYFVLGLFVFLIALMILMAALKVFGD